MSRENIEMDISSYKHKILKIRTYTKNMDVLFAEDYLPLHDSLLNIFNALFRSVDAATNGKDALDFYEKKRVLNEKYDIVFSDIEMPELNGLELVAKIRKIKKDDNVVIFSAYQDSKYLLELINLNVRRFILKPVSLGELLDEIDYIIDEIKDETMSTLYLSDSVTFNKEESVLYLKNTPIAFTKSEQFVVELFVSKLNQVVSNEDIVSYLYENMIDINIDNVRKLMYKLRQKLPKNFIQSIHGIGYRVVKSDGDK